MLKKDLQSPLGDFDKRLKDAGFKQKVSELLELWVTGTGSRSYTIQYLSQKTGLTITDCLKFISLYEGEPNSKNTITKYARFQDHGIGDTQDTRDTQLSDPCPDLQIPKSKVLQVQGKQSGPVERDPQEVPEWGVQFRLEGLPIRQDEVESSLQHPIGGNSRVQEDQHPTDLRRGWKELHLKIQDHGSLKELFCPVPGAA